MDLHVLLLAQVAVKGTVVVVVAAAVGHGFANRSAAARHFAWTVALAALVVLPMASLVLPAWRVHLPVIGTAPVLGQSAANLHGQRAFLLAALAVEQEPRMSRAAAVTHERRTRLQRLPFRSDGSSWDASTTSLPSRTRRTLASSDGLGRRAFMVFWAHARDVTGANAILTVWMVGVFLVLAHAAISVSSARRVVRRSCTLVSVPWATSFVDVARRLALHRPVQLLESSDITMPAAWGVTRPVVLIPASAYDWSDDLRRVVLLHELAHVERWDCLTHAVAQIACALHWFNPLVWWAAHRLEIERERACDDRVLGQGTPASEYAEHLVAVARAQRLCPGGAAGVLAMARRSQLRDRLQRVLDHTVPRSAVTRGCACFTGAVTACLVLPGAVLQPRMPVAFQSVRATGSAIVAVRSAAVADTERPTSAMLAPVAGRAPIRSTSRGSDTLPSDTPAGGTPAGVGDDVHWSRVIAAGDTLRVSGLTGGIRVEPTSGDRVEVVAHRLWTGRDPKLVSIETSVHDHSVHVCAIYPVRRPWTCDTYTGDLNDIKCGDSTVCRDARVDWVVRLPAGVRFAGYTMLGDITATGLWSDVAAISVGGDITVSTTGHIQAFTMQRVNATMGSTNWTGDLKISAGRGITLTLPEDASTLVDAHSQFGSIESDFPLARHADGAFGVKASGTIGHGGRSLKLNTLDGRISIRSAGNGRITAALVPTFQAATRIPVLPRPMVPEPVVSELRVPEPRIGALARAASAGAGIGAAAGAGIGATATASQFHADGRTCDRAYHVCTRR